jgi:hypothetical protein
MSQVVLLRRLSLKSKLGFGKYREHTVSRLIELKGNVGLLILRSAYFNLSNISFLDEILLNVLKINQEDLFSKPGKNYSKELREKYFKPKEKYLDTNPMTKYNVEKSVRYSQRKGVLQTLNHI